MSEQFANDFIALLPSAESSARRATTIKPHAKRQDHWMKVLTVPKEELASPATFNNERQMLLSDRSELELEGELDRARAADLIERIEATIGPAGAKAAGQCLC